jgi:hypothetical protein
MTDEFPSAAATPAPAPLCPVRLALSDVVVKAVARSCKARAAYDDARKRKDNDQNRYASDLVEARAHEREAERNLREHIREHAC